MHWYKCRIINRFGGWKIKYFTYDCLHFLREIRGKTISQPWEESKKANW